MVCLLLGGSRVLVLARFWVLLHLGTNTSRCFAMVGKKVPVVYMSHENLMSPDTSLHPQPKLPYLPDQQVHQRWAPQTNGVPLGCALLIP